MKRMIAFMAILYSLMALTPVSAADLKPNIIFIMADDLGNADHRS